MIKIFFLLSMFLISACSAFGVTKFGEWSNAIEGIKGRLIIENSRVSKDAPAIFFVELENISPHPVFVPEGNTIFSGIITADDGTRVKPIWARADVLTMLNWKKVEGNSSIKIQVTYPSSEVTVDTGLDGYKLSKGHYNLSGSFGYKEMALTNEKTPRNAWQNVLQLSPIKFNVS